MNAKKKIKIRLPDSCWLWGRMASLCLFMLYVISSPLVADNEPHLGVDIRDLDEDSFQFDVTGRIGNIDENANLSDVSALYEWGWNISVENKRVPYEPKVIERFRQEPLIVHEGIDFWVVVDISMEFQHLNPPPAHNHTPLESEATRFVHNVKWPVYTKESRNQFRSTPLRDIRRDIRAVRHDNHTDVYVLDSRFDIGSLSFDTLVGAAHHSIAYEEFELWEKWKRENSRLGDIPKDVPDRETRIAFLEVYLTQDPEVEAGPAESDPVGGAYLIVDAVANRLFGQFFTWDIMFVGDGTFRIVKKNAEGDEQILWEIKIPPSEPGDTGGHVVVDGEPVPESVVNELMDGQGIDLQVHNENDEVVASGTLQQVSESSVDGDQTTGSIEKLVTLKKGDILTWQIPGYTNAENVHHEIVYPPNTAIAGVSHTATEGVFSITGNSPGITFFIIRSENPAGSGRNKYCTVEVRVGVPDWKDSTVFHSYPGVATLYISWPKANGEVDEYMIFVNGQLEATLPAEDVENPDDEFMSYTITGLLPGTEYEVTIHANNSNGSSLELSDTFSTETLTERLDALRSYIPVLISDEAGRNVLLENLDTVEQILNDATPNNDETALDQLETVIEILEGTLGESHFIVSDVLDLYDGIYAAMFANITTLFEAMDALEIFIGAAISDEVTRNEILEHLDAIDDIIFDLGDPLTIDKAAVLEQLEEIETKLHIYYGSTILSEELYPYAEHITTNLNRLFDFFMNPEAQTDYLVPDQDGWVRNVTILDLRTGLPPTENPGTPYPLWVLLGDNLGNPSVDDVLSGNHIQASGNWFALFDNINHARTLVAFLLYNKTGKDLVANFDLQSDDGVKVLISSILAWINSIVRPPGDPEHTEDQFSATLKPGWNVVAVWVYNVTLGCGFRMRITNPATGEPFHSSVLDMTPDDIAILDFDNPNSNADNLSTSGGASFAIVPDFDEGEEGGNIMAFFYNNTEETPNSEIMFNLGDPSGPSQTGLLPALSESVIENSTFSLQVQQAPTNSPAPFYFGLTDISGNTAVQYSDPTAIALNERTTFEVPLVDLTNQGVSVQQPQNIFVGVGDYSAGLGLLSLGHDLSRTYNLSNADAAVTGTIFIDNIEFHPNGLAKQNLLSNPGFESGSKTGWTHPLCDMRITSDQVHSGNYSAYIYNRTDTWQGPRNSVLGQLQNGKTYRVSFWVRLENAQSDNIGLTVLQTDAAGTSYTSLQWATGYSSRWVQLSGTFTMNATGTVTELQFYVEGPRPGVNFYVDDALVEEQ